jgi:hypothetical protein
MRKAAFILAAIATLTSNGAFAQSTSNKKPMTGSGAKAATYSTNDNFAWGIGLGALAILGIVAGLSAGAGSQNPNNFSH